MVSNSVRFVVGAVRGGALVIAAFLLLAKEAPVAAAGKNRGLPTQITVSIQFSTLTEASPKWEDLEAQYLDGSLIRRIKGIRHGRTRVVVPVFDSGQTFYDTKVAPFANRNVRSLAQGKALDQFLSDCHRAGIPVLLGCNALAWQKAGDAWAPGRPANLFAEFPELEELTKDIEPPPVGTRFASPWSADVRDSLARLVAEMAVRFPTAAGVALDVHLSRGEVMGFSAQARLAAQHSLNLDPVHLGVQGTADENLAPRAAEWMHWRTKSLAELAEALAMSWRNAKSDGTKTEVWLCGSADYDTVQNFDSLRSGQDFLSSLSFQYSSPPRPVFNGVLLEGHWGSLSSAVWANLRQATNHPSLVPVLDSGRDSSVPSLLEGWGWAKSLGSAGQAGIIVRNSESWQEALAFLRGNQEIVKQTPLQAKTVAPPIQFVLAGKPWNFKSVLGRNAMLLINMPRGVGAKEFPKLRQVMQKLQPDLALREVLIAWVTEKTVAPLETNTAPPATYLELADESGEWLARCPEGMSVTFIDHAGFIRAIEQVTSADSLLAKIKSLADTEPEFASGSAAPEFRVMDMNGQVRDLANLKGKKGLILSFFPKCFTGGCANHMSSLNAQLEVLHAAGIEVLGVSIDAADVQRDFAKRWNLGFTLVPDTGRNLCALYDAVSDADALADRQTVFIDREGIVRFVDRNVNVYTHGADVVSRLEKLGMLKERAQDG